MANNYLKYTSKDYNSIYADLVGAIPSITDLWTNTEDGDPGIVLVKLMSALGDMLSYNMDKQALEYYSPTVTQRKNAAKLFSLIGYKMHWYQSATNRISITNTIPVPILLSAVRDYRIVLAYDELTVLTPEQQKERDRLEASCFSILSSSQFMQKYPARKYPSYYNRGMPTVEFLTDPNSPVVKDYEAWLPQNTLNIYTYICSNNKTITVKNGNKIDTSYIIKPTISSNVDSSGNYLGSTDTIEPGQTHDFDVIQGTLNSIKFTPIRLRNNRYYFPESAIDENNIWLSWTGTANGQNINAETFIDKTDNLLTVTDGNLYFEFGVDDFDNPYIELPSYWVNKIKESVEFTLYYVRTSGVYGNVTKDFLDTLEGFAKNKYTITHPANTSPYIDKNGRLVATPGYHPQTAHEAYIASLNYVTTFDTLVTIYDFERFVKRQEGFANAYAVDKQRARDLNNALEKECYSLSLAQLQAYYNQGHSDTNNITPSLQELQRIYIARKRVVYNERDEKATYLPYSLNLHIVYGNFDIYAEEYIEGIGEESIIASMDNYNKRFWLYQLEPNYEVEYKQNEDGSYVTDDNGELIPIDVNYKSVYDVSGKGRASHYLDEKFRTTKIVNVLPQYAAVRVFPWRCCGTIYLKNPVTSTVANKILQTVMEHLASAFHPSNIEFGQKIKYMDVINVVTSSHDEISYFDAGLNSRQLIDIDESVDMTYFNNTSIMYYVQRPNNYYISIHDMQTFSDCMPGNNEPYLPSTGSSENVPNPYYNILSIAPEYIVD